MTSGAKHTTREGNDLGTWNHGFLLGSGDAGPSLKLTWLAPSLVPALTKIGLENRRVETKNDGWKTIRLPFGMIRPIFKGYVKFPGCKYGYP